MTEGLESEREVEGEGEVTRRLDAPPTAPREHGSPDAASELRRRKVFSSLFTKPSEPVRFDRFVLLECIASGGMGELYLAHDEELDRKVALKLVRTGRRQHRADDRLHREAQALAKISHPNVVPVFQAGRVEGRVYVAMEYVRGQTLSAWLDARAPLDGAAGLHEILRVFVDAGRGLAAVHAAGLAHRDFKPDNVLIGEDGRVRVVDFGLARAVETESGEVGPAELGDEGEPLDTTPPATGPGQATLTATGTVMGTPRYMAPEQWAGRRGDARSDQFSFCVALYEAIYATRPFDGHTVVGLARSVSSGEPREPPRRAEIPASLRAAILRGLAADPSRRFADFDELLAVLERVLAPPRSRLPIALALTLLATLIGGGSWLARGSGRLEFDTAAVERELAAARQLATIEARVVELEAAGLRDDADAAFEAFADAPELAGTHALARGWLFQAERRAARGERAPELAALVEAYLEGPGLEQRAALLGLARHFEGHGVEAHLPAAIASLAALERELGPAPPAMAQAQRRLEIVDAVRRRDFASAQARLAPADPLGPALRELGKLTRTGQRSRAFLIDLRPLPGLDLDADGRGELVVLPQGEDPTLVLGSQPELPVLHTLEHAELGLSTRPDQVLVVGPSLPTGGATPSWLACRAGHEFSLVELEPASGRASPRVLHRWTHPHALATPTRWVLGDLDRVPGFEAYGAESTGLRVVRVGPQIDAPWQVDAPDPATAATRSVLNGALVGDLDGDGRDELIVAASEWSAYDLRVLQPDPERPDRLRVVARHKLGTLSGLALVPAPSGRGHRIGVMVAPRYPNRRLFPADAPGGLAEGYYLLAWAGLGEPLVIVDRLPDVKDSHDVHVGDLDGDGRVDLALASTLGGWSTSLLLGQPEGGFTPLRIAGVWPIGFAALDDDPDAELLMIEVDDESQPGGPLMVVGAGTDALPPAPLPAIAARPAPPELDAGLARSWTRAEQLAVIGLANEASAALRELATRVEPELAAAARVRAAELIEDLHPALAIELYERAGTLAALARAVDLLEESIAFVDALRVAERLLAESSATLDADARARWTARIAALRRLAAPTDRRVFEFDALDEGWRIAAELALRHEPGGLRVDTLTRVGQRVLARRPLVWEGGPIELEVELDLLRLEWGAGIEFELRPLDEAPTQPDQRPLAIGIDAWGGSGTYELAFIGVSDVQSPHAIGLPVAHPRAELPPERRRHRLGLHVLPERDQLWATVSAPGVSARVEHPLGPRRPGRYELVIQTSGFPWVRGAARIERLSLRGLIDDPDAAPATRREQIVLALTRGEPELALALLQLEQADEPGLEPRDAALLELLALDELGRWTEAAAKLDEATEHCSPSAASRSLLGVALLGRPDRFGPALRELCRPALLYDAVWTATETTIAQHPESTDVPRTLTTQLLGLERAEPRTPDEALILMRLLRARAHGWDQQDAPAAQRADLLRALDIGLDISDIPDASGSAFAGELAHVHRELALALLERGDQAGAIEQLGLALACSPTPELVADRIVAEPAFAGLLDDREWSEQLERARSGRWWMR